MLASLRCQNFCVLICLISLLVFQVRGATVKHLVLGSTLVVLHLGILAIAAKRLERR